MGLLRKNNNEIKNKNEKLPDLNSERLLSDDLDKVAGGMSQFQAGIGRPNNNGKGIKK